MELFVGLKGSIEDKYKKCIMQRLLLLFSVVKIAMPLLC